ncbi:chorismate mutase [Streptomyces sp. NBC_00503]|uniref:chorismate mutase n=1 Tax=Streptomyces sp. NBC_00503 TaxID=2903659 RepID=UPI002E81C6A7|nr:chorismate mutase [Streptomyces sp. NBC_00503]WUD86558.1 chorismate mutase [Streptomyces sp. NBC_00503]
MSPVATQDITRQDHQVVELDATIIDLVRRRTELVTELQQAKSRVGLPRTQLVQETEMLNKYRSALGAQGTNLALLLLKLGNKPELLPQAW